LIGYPRKLMVPYWAIFSIALYLFPLALLFVALEHPERPVWRAALGVPTFVAVDLMGTLLLSHLMRLENATLVSRGLWLTGGSAVLYRRRATVKAWWRNTDLREWINPSIAALFAVWVSSVLSFTCGLWDRWWHIPLVTSLGGQRAPFLNFFEQNEPLAYHYAGDALASMLQALSFTHIHSAYALSRMHDVLFGLIGLTLAGLLPSFGAKRLVWALAATATTLLAGPANILVQGDARPLFGKSLVNLLSLSFRPHVPVAYLSILGFVGALLLPVISRKPIRAGETRLILIASTGLLALCDETSLALLGVLLAVVWFAAPKSLGDTRKQGILVGVTLLAAILTTVLLNGGTLVHGAISSDFKLVPTFRVPGFVTASAPLVTRAAWKAFLTDYFAIVLVCIAGIMAAVTVRTRPVIAMAAGYGAVGLVALLALTKIQINGSDSECHRLATLPLFLAPLFGFYFTRQPGRAWAFERSASLVTLVVGLGVGIPAASTAEWLLGTGASICQQQGDDTYAGTDCREFALAKLGEASIPAYVDANLWYRFAGCRPLRAQSTSRFHRVIHLGFPEMGWPRLRKIDGWLGNAPLSLYCSIAKPDDVCTRAMQAGDCSIETSSIKRCTLSAQQRRTLAH
jgi:hypothetical protein